jgi:hypothetical protein
LRCACRNKFDFPRLSKNGFAATQKSFPLRRQPDAIMIQDKPLKSSLERRKTFDSALANHFSSVMQSSLSVRPAFYPGFCLLNQIDECRHFVPRALTGKTLPFCRRHVFPEIGFHGEKCLPAFDRPLTGQIPGFPATVGKIELVSKPRTPNLQMIILIHGAALLKLQKKYPSPFSVGGPRGISKSACLKTAEPSRKIMTFPGGSA